MLKDQDIICISSIDWDFIWQGHQEIMSTLASNGNRVLFIENTGVRSPNLEDIPRLKKRIYNWFHSVKGIRKERENLYIYSPLILPFPYSRIARLINRRVLVSALDRWLKSVAFSNPIIWTFLPTGIVLDIINAIDSKIIIYYCIDNFAASSSQAKRIKKTEDLLLKKADLVFVTAQNLYDRCAMFNKNVHIFPYGVNVSIYEKARNAAIDAPADIATIRRPIVGYIGGIHKWMDFGLIRFLAEDHPEKSFVFVGPAQRDINELKKVGNVYFLGQKRYEELPLYISQFDVCIIPYLFTEYTRNVYPTKLNEYLSLGKPVIATSIPEVEAFNERNSNVVSIAKTQEGFSMLIRKDAQEKITKEIYEKRIEVATKEGSWSRKIEMICELVERKIADKEKEKALEWKVNLLKIYRISKKRLVPAALITLFIYVTVFHTGMLWFIGRPLKLTSPVEKADAIVILAGGVGESGKAGQGYEERVKYGIELYEKGYAQHLIFSSGYRYAFKEAEVMKALAVSLGVPERSIILEENAKNNYENIKLSHDILLKEHWDSAILISSPYNMLRSSLVCKKVAPEITFIYAPIPSSLFYGDEKKVYPKHIMGIIHEYLGIVYYCLKGYI